MAHRRSLHGAPSADDVNAAITTPPRSSKDNLAAKDYPRLLSAEQLSALAGEDGELLRYVPKTGPANVFLRFEPILENAYQASRTQTRRQGARYTAAMGLAAATVWYQYAAVQHMVAYCISTLPASVALLGISAIPCHKRMSWAVQASFVLVTIVRIIVREQYVAPALCSTEEEYSKPEVVLDVQTMAITPLIMQLVFKFCVDVPAWLVSLAMLLTTAAGAFSTNPCLHVGHRGVPLVWGTLATYLAATWYAETASRSSFIADLEKAQLQLHIQAQEDNAAEHAAKLKENAALKEKALLQKRLHDQDIQRLEQGEANPDHT